jgi:hypothetical protein
LCFAGASGYRARRLVGKDDDAILTHLCRYEFQGCLFVFPEEQLTAAHDDRVDREPELIKQVVFQQRLPEKTMAVYDKILADLLLKLGRLGRYLALDYRRVVPISPLQGRRENVFAHSVNPVGVVAGSSGPNPREDLVCSSPHQHRVARQ